MNLTELVAATASEGGFDTSSTGTTEATITRWINDAYRRMVARSQWHMAQIAIGTTVADQAEYALSADVVDLRGVLVGSEPYKRTGQEKLWDLKAGIRSLTGRGGVYAPDFTSAGTHQIELYPAPTEAGEAITGLAALYPTTLVDAATPVVPEEFHEAIVDGAIAIGLRRVEENAADAAAHEDSFNQRTEELRRRKNSRLGSGPIQIEVGGYS